MLLHPTIRLCHGFKKSRNCSHLGCKLLCRRLLGFLSACTHCFLFCRLFLCFLSPFFLLVKLTLTGLKRLLGTLPALDLEGLSCAGCATGNRKWCNLQSIISQNFKLQIATIRVTWVMDLPLLTVFICKPISKHMFGSIRQSAKLQVMAAKGSVSVSAMASCTRLLVIILVMWYCAKLKLTN